MSSRMQSDLKVMAAVIAALLVASLFSPADADARRVGGPDDWEHQVPEIDPDDHDDEEVPVAAVSVRSTTFATSFDGFPVVLLRHVITNTGNVTLTNPTIVIQGFDFMSDCPFSSLAPGQTADCGGFVPRLESIVTINSRFVAAAHPGPILSVDLVTVYRDSIVVNPRGELDLPINDSVSHIAELAFG